MPIASLRVLPNKYSREILELIGGAALIALVLIMVNLQVMAPAFQAIEERQAVEDSDRVAAELAHEVESLTGPASDWAGRDSV